MFYESIFPYATPGVSVDIPTLREAITFPSHEPATHDHVRQYDLSYLSTNPPLLGDDAIPMQVPLVRPIDTPFLPAMVADMASYPTAVADVAVSPTAAQPTVTFPAAAVRGAQCLLALLHMFLTRPSSPSRVLLVALLF
jgi:hypothetical protein